MTMNRRKFVGTAAASASLLVLPSWVIASVNEPSVKITRIRIGYDRRHWKVVGSGVEVRDGREVPWSVSEPGPRPAGPSPPDDEDNYDAEVVETSGRYFYRAKGTTIEVTEYEADRVIGNPHLYYFTVALKLHMRIKRATGLVKSSSGAEVSPVHSLASCNERFDIGEFPAG